jgi:hypothetical protein
MAWLDLAVEDRAACGGALHLLAAFRGELLSWRNALNDDRKLVVTLAAQAQRARDLIMQADREPDPEPGRHPEAVASDTEAETARPQLSPAPSLTTIRLADRENGGVLYRAEG